MPDPKVVTIEVTLIRRPQVEVRLESVDLTEKE